MGPLFDEAWREQALRGDAGANDPVFPSSRKSGGLLTERAVHGIVKRSAAKAGVNQAISPHWLRHAHGSHAIDRGASLPEMQATLGHSNVAPLVATYTRGPTAQAGSCSMSRSSLGERRGTGPLEIGKDSGVESGLSR